MRTLLLPLTLLSTLLATTSCATQIGGNPPDTDPDCETCDLGGLGEAQQKLNDFAKRCDEAKFSPQSQNVSIGPSPNNAYRRIMAECLGNFSLECVEGGEDVELDFFENAPPLDTFNGDMSQGGTFKTATGRVLSFVACSAFDESGTCAGEGVCTGAPGNECISDFDVAWCDGDTRNYCEWGASGYELTQAECTDGCHLLGCRKEIRDAINEYASSEICVGSGVPASCTDEFFIDCFGVDLVTDCGSLGCGESDGLTKCGSECTEAANWCATDNELFSCSGAGVGAKYEYCDNGCSVTNGVAACNP